MSSERGGDGERGEFGAVAVADPGGQLDPLDQVGAVVGDQQQRLAAGVAAAELSPGAAGAAAHRPTSHQWVASLGRARSNGVVEVGLAVLDDQLVGEELQGVGVAVPRGGEGCASGGEQVGVLELCCGELPAQPVDDSGSGVGPHRAQSRIPEIRWITAVAAALM